MKDTTETGPADRLGSGAMFDGIADRYDILNRVNALGMDKSWRRAMVRALDVRPHHRVLDLATGTGDVLQEVARVVPQAALTGLDPSQQMLDKGRDKVPSATWVHGEAEALPFDDHSFDRATMSFGIRNCTDRPQALREIRRVLAPGGRLALLELSEPDQGVLAPIARLHMKHVVPRVGAFVLRSREYAYLSESIQAFPKPEAFARQIEQAGFHHATVHRFAFGACVLFVADRKEDV